MARQLVDTCCCTAPITRVVSIASAMYVGNRLRCRRCEPLLRHNAGGPIAAETLQKRCRNLQPTGIATTDPAAGNALCEELVLPHAARRATDPRQRLRCRRGTAFGGPLLLHCVKHEGVIDFRCDVVASLLKVKNHHLLICRAKYRC